ncbi:MAG: PfkB family carbohydrate kinase [Bacillota bacterium]|nr:PfkB family carbohydrate kinase [Bacillota bacterium]
MQVAEYGLGMFESIGLSLAGDAFTAGMLHHMLSYASLSEFLGQEAHVSSALHFANACAALCVTKRGAIAAMPVLTDVRSMIYGNHGAPKNNHTHYATLCSTEGSVFMSIPFRAAGAISSSSAVVSDLKNNFLRAGF